MEKTLLLVVAVGACAHFVQRSACLRQLAVAAWTAVSAAAMANVSVQETPPTPQEAAWAQRVDQLVTQAALAAIGGRKDVRIDVRPGRLDPRLKLAACDQVELHLPSGQKPWGAMRVGLRCVAGAGRWNVFLPVTVKVFAPAVQARETLAAGTTLTADHLQMGEADWAATPSAAYSRTEALLGRTLLHSVGAGSALRESDLKRRQWFAVGDVVQVVATGRGFSVGAEGVALSPGIEGQPARVRTESGRTLTGIATADRRVELIL